MPFFKSSSYHGYDVIDYYKIDEKYGNDRDFQKFINMAHKRDIKVIIDLVLNHTSLKHPWFKDSCKAKNDQREGLPFKSNSKIDWYVWKDIMPNGWTKPWGGGISKDVWHYKNGAYYYTAFCWAMPDLNYRNEDVIKQIKNIIKYWLDKRVDGFRLDGVRYLVEKNGGVSGQADIEETHKVLKELVSYAKSINKDCMFVGEVCADNKNVSKYYNKGDELTCAFNFDLAGAIKLFVPMNNFTEIEKVLNIMDSYDVPLGFYCPFLSNHDQDRVASVMKGDIRKLKLSAALLLSMQGDPYVYYGEEIGMTGKGRHERIRTPMQWDCSRNSGFTKGKPWERLHNNYKQINVENQESDNNSLLNYYKKLIRIRNKYGKVLKVKRRQIKMANNNIYAYIYIDKHESILFIHNFNESKEMIDLKFFKKDPYIKKCKVFDLLNNKIKCEDGVTLNKLKNFTLEKYESLIFRITDNSKTEHGYVNLSRDRITLDDILILDNNVKKIIGKLIKPGSVTVSSVHDNNPQLKFKNLIDNNLNTRWSSEFNDDQWIIIDLKGKEKISGLVLNWETAYARSYSISVSDDKDNWKKIYTDNNCNGAVDKINLNSVYTRFIRLDLLKRATPWGFSLFEIKIFGVRH